MRRSTRARRVAHTRSEPTRGGRAASESGESLIELIVTVALMAIAITALLSTLFAVIVSASSHRRHVQAANEATTVAESIDRLPYVGCATADTYDAALATVPTPGFAADVVLVRHLVSSTAASASYAEGCPGGGDQGAQELTVRVSSVKGTPVEAEVVVVKRDDACPTDALTVQALQIAEGDRC